MTDTAPKKKSVKGSKGFSTAKPIQSRPHLQAQERERKRALREERIQRIADIMSQVHVPGGIAPSWDRKVRKALAASWGLTDQDMRKLSAEASKRVGTESLDPNELRRVYGPTLASSIVECFAKRDFRNLARYIEIAHKVAQDQIAGSKDQKVEVTVITPADAAAAVREMFGENAAKDAVTDESRERSAEDESADGAEQSPSEE